jgi:hypothetical protein
MKNLAPDILRQRLLIEGFYTVDVTRQTIEDYFKEITTKLDLRMYAKPFIHSPEGLGKEENQGFDAFVPLIDSGISLYVWSKQKFVSAVLFTCKKFDEKKATEVTKHFFKIKEAEALSF